MINKVAYIINVFFDHLSKILNHYSCCVYSTIGIKSQFYATAKIINTQKNKSKINIGEHSHVRGELFVFGHGGEILIGNYCYIGEGSKIWSASKVLIGNRVMIAHYVNIHDNISHPLDSQERHKHFKHIIDKGHPKKDLDISTVDIIIENDVWIGFNSTILKGVTIGEGSIVSAGSVVIKDIPPYVLVAGNPAKIIRKLK